MVNNGALIRNYTLTLAGIKSKADKQCKLKELCGAIGLVYQEGGNFSSGHIEYSNQTTKDKLTSKMSALIELLDDCHFEINIKNYRSTELFDKVTKTIRELLNISDDNEIKSLTNNILGLMTHRKDGRWYKFESSLSSPPRHAALLMSFLKKEFGENGYIANLSKNKSCNLGKIDSDQRDQFLKSFYKFGLTLSKENVPSNSKKVSSALLNNYINFRSTENSRHKALAMIPNTLEIVQQHVENYNIKSLYNDILSLNVQFSQVCDKLDKNFFNDIVRKLTDFNITGFIYDSENNDPNNHNEYIDLIYDFLKFVVKNNKNLYTSTLNHLNVSIKSFMNITNGMKQDMTFVEHFGGEEKYSFKLRPFLFIFQEDKNSCDERIKMAEELNKTSFVPYTYLKRLN